MDSENKSRTAKHISLRPGFLALGLAIITLFAVSAPGARLIGHNLNNPAVSPARADDGDQSGNVDDGETSDARANNIVNVQNTTDDRMRMRSSIQLNHIQGNDVEPVNQAFAYSSCTDCQTFAVALQIDLRSRTATNVAPQNAAVAVNYQCHSCTTMAWAMQFVVPVDDPRQTPDDVQGLIHDMDKELRSIARDHDQSPASVATRIQAVLDQFTSLGNSLYTQRDEHDTDDHGEDTGRRSMVLPFDLPAKAA